MSIKLRVLLGISALICIALIQGFYMLWQTFHLGSMTEEVAINAKIASSARTTWDDFRSTRDFLNKTLTFTEFEQAIENNRKFSEKIQNLDKDLSQIESLTTNHSAVQYSLLIEAKKHFQEWEKMARKHLTQQELFLPTYDALEQEAILLEKALNQLVALSLKESEESTITSTIQIQRSWISTITGLILGGLAILFLSYIMFKKIAKPITLLHQFIFKLTQTGEFYHQIDYESQDELGLLMKNINKLTTLLNQTFNDINHVMAAVAKGDFSYRVTVLPHGDLLKLKNNINYSVEKIDLMMHELITVMHALRQGDFTKRVSPQIEGEFKQEVDAAMEATQNIIADINDTMLALSTGIFSQRVCVNASGDLASLKNSINLTIDVFTTTMQDLNHIFSAMAQGDLTQKLRDSHYQNAYYSIATNINHAISSLKNLIFKTVRAVNTISYAVQEIALGNSDLAQRTSKQAHFIENTVLSLEAFMQTIQNNSQQVQSTNEYIMQSTKIAEKGGQVVSQVMNTMQDITVSSNQINDIINMIDTISFQTNILALNAAVESARAGEAGRGFAVVSNEVRLLAQRSAEAAREITKLITQNVGKIQKGSHLVETAGSTTKEIIASIQAITDLMGQVTSASVEQTNLVQNVKISVEQIEVITQQNAALVEQVASASDSLAEQSRDLENAMSIFKV